MKLKRNKHTSNSIPTKYHIIFWVSYFAFNVIRWGIQYNDYERSLKDNIVEFLLSIIFVYINLLIFIPKFLLTKKYKRYLIYLLGLLILYSFFKVILDHFFLGKGFNRGYITITVGELYVFAFTMSIKLAVDWINEKNTSEKLKRENLKAELKFLKAQIQPHFFFNTLNNLYALTLIKSDEAPSVVLKLSDIMRYVLYEIKGSKVDLLKEINYIESYIFLEKLRCNSNAKFTTEIKKDIDAIQVPPLLFLPFIENCFKHGSKNEDDFYVHIKFENINDNFLKFSVENKYNKKIISTSPGGIGNENVRRRLDLLFKDNYTLKIIKSDSRYEVQVEIPIK